MNVNQLLPIFQFFLNQQRMFHQLQYLWNVIEIPFNDWLYFCTRGMRRKTKYWASIGQKYVQTVFQSQFLFSFQFFAILLYVCIVCLYFICVWKLFNLTAATMKNTMEQQQYTPQRYNCCTRCFLIVCTTKPEQEIYDAVACC